MSITGKFYMKSKIACKKNTTQGVETSKLLNDKKVYQIFVRLSL
jgi:hypothetical protein